MPFGRFVTLADGELCTPTRGTSSVFSGSVFGAAEVAPREDRQLGMHWSMRRGTVASGGTVRRFGEAVRALGRGDLFTRGVASRLVAVGRFGSAGACSAWRAPAAAVSFLEAEACGRLRLFALLRIVIIVRSW